VRGLAVAVIVSVIVATISATTIYAQQNYEIPAWVKGVAGFWAEDKISDNDFGEGLSFLIENEIIQVPKIQSLKNEIVQLQSENKNLKGDIAFLENENTDLRRQVVDLNKPIQNSPSQSYEPKTTEQKSSLSYPKITKRYDGDEAVNKIKELLAFNDSLSQTQRKELAFRSVSESEFVIGTTYAGEWTVTWIEGNFDFQENNGRNIAVFPFDCSHNMDYIYSIVGAKIDESGKISIFLFKNGVLIGYESSEKPYGTATVAGICDEPYTVN